MRDREELEGLKLKAIALLRCGTAIGEVCRQCGVADTTLMKWRAQLAPELISGKKKAKYRALYSDWKASGTNYASYAAEHGISHNTMRVAKALCEAEASGMHMENKIGEMAASGEEDSTVIFYDGPLATADRTREVRTGPGQEVRMELALGGGMLCVSCAAAAAGEVVRAMASVMGGACGRA